MSELGVSESVRMLPALRQRCCLGVLLAGVIMIQGFLAGCSVASSAATGISDNLSVAVLDQPDPELVRQGLPTYLLLMDAVIIDDPNNPALLSAAANLYAAYGSAFVIDVERERTLTARGKAYGDRALCAKVARTCNLTGSDFDSYIAAIASVSPGAADALYAYCVGNLAYIRAHSDDWNALADLPKIENALVHLLAIGAAQDAGSVNKYLGILNTIRPEALGGQPERGRAYFEEAIELTEGRDLSVKVEFARGYARLLYERELHDRLLNEVLTADVQQPGYTLFNQLAQDQAVELLATADDYF